MKAKMAMRSLLICSLLFLVGCASLEAPVHKYLMRGQVLDVTDGVAYLCIGSKEGAEVGQEYVVYRSVKEWNPGAKYRPFTYKRLETGKIRIEHIVDEHYATAKILSGDVKENDLAELSR